MTTKITTKQIIFLLGIVLLSACKVPAILSKQETKSTPATYNSSQDTTYAASMKWSLYFKDPYLISLLDTALKNNQELNITMQEIEMSKNEIMARKGEYLPFLSFRGAAGPDRAGKYTWDGFSEEDLKANPSRGPKYIGDFMAATYFSWEIDAWKKLRNATKSASIRYFFFH